MLSTNPPPPAHSPASTATSAPLAIGPSPLSVPATSSRAAPCSPAAGSTAPTTTTKTPSSSSFSFPPPPPSHEDEETLKALARSRKRNRLEFFNDHHGKRLRLDVKNHTPELDGKPRWCALCGSWRDGRRGHRSSHKCDTCAVNLCVKKHNGVQLNCWAIWHTQPQLKVRVELAATPPLGHHMSAVHVARRGKGQGLSTGVRKQSEVEKETETNTKTDTQQNVVLDSKQTILKGKAQTTDNRTDAQSQTPALQTHVQQLLPTAQIVTSPKPAQISAPSFTTQQQVIHTPSQPPLQTAAQHPSQPLQQPSPQHQPPDLDKCESPIRTVGQRQDREDQTSSIPSIKASSLENVSSLPVSSLRSSMLTSESNT